MMTAFQAAMAKLAVIGQDVSQLIDCSEVVGSHTCLASLTHLPMSSRVDPDAAAPGERRALPRRTQ